MMEKKFEMKPVFAMWLKESKKGSKYLSGKLEDGTWVRGFFNGKKSNPKEPDVRIYKQTEGGDLEKTEYTSLWVNVSKAGKKYLSGKVDGKKVVGFIIEKAEVNGKRPYFSVYWSEAEPKEKQETMKEVEYSDIPF